MVRRAFIACLLALATAAAAPRRERRDLFFDAATRAIDEPMALK